MLLRATKEQVALFPQYQDTIIIKIRYYFVNKLDWYFIICGDKMYSLEGNVHHNGVTSSYF